MLRKIQLNSYTLTFYLQTVKTGIRIKLCLSQMKSIQKKTLPLCNFLSPSPKTLYMMRKEI